MNNGDGIFEYLVGFIIGLILLAICYLAFMY